MTAAPQIEAFLNDVKTAFNEGNLVRLKLMGYHGPEEALKSVEIKKIVVKRLDKLSFTYRYKTRDIIKNHILPEAIGLLRADLGDAFRTALLETTEFDLSFERQGDKVRTKRHKASRPVPSASHDRAKNRLIAPEGKSYLHALKITDAQGNVLKAAQDKYRQINKMVEIFAPLIQAIPADRLHKIVDMGSGKGYLTFALFDYLTNTAKADVEIVGVEFRDELVTLCNGIAGDAGFAKLRFEQGAIEQFDSSDASVVIALHACDTATDDAIHKGIVAGAELIAVAPCCHKQIRRQIEAGKARNDLDFLLSHGVFMERQAEMVTDGLRSLILEAAGYKTKVFEFISDAHTPKNVLIVAQKTHIAASERTAILNRIEATKAYFGIGYHHLERLQSL
ncbi:SAM-dependent methyltransferase [Devosia rhodophyticola]|uniref:SAM-dependent methyltransferase n=1 Tax=Devosia rhodophyticola TaxID=3026423 RepID=A0ABY7YVK5_9HYPH|nr:SAM-dependent methyltransferase [Devosia rhodophyticola]WDR05393.1 SAM-dependent methyltransferase [Devosia rhodophyticola]